jgi:alkanesulfonate monooxygenase SsuD/methylene tetrahydromethanopterin reductase-like flavin-dependent oxidoreductase (luciferase family)
MNRSVHFGYNPPSSDRELERVDPATFVRDLERMLEVIGPAVDSVWVSDHFAPNDRFRLECWTLLTWIAARHPGMSIGTIVAAVGYRHAPLFAKMFASLDVLMESASEATGEKRARPIFGIGAGWTKEEYVGYGYDFPPTKERIAQMDEALTVAKLLWDGGPVDFEGRFYRLDGAYAIPPRQPRPLIMVGGEGPTTMAVAARQADWWNLRHGRPETIRETLARMDSICADVGRDPSTLRRTMYLRVFLDADAARARADAGTRLDDEFPPFAGDPAAFTDHLAGLVEQGVDGFQLVFAGWPDTRDLELFAEHVRPAFPRDPD